MRWVCVIRCRGWNYIAGKLGTRGRRRSQRRRMNAKKGERHLTAKNYEPHNEDEEVSDSELSLESEHRVDERSTVHTGGDEEMCTFGEGEGLVGGNVGVGDKCKVKAPKQTNQLQLQHRVAVVNESDVVLWSRCTIKKLVGLNARMTAMQREAVKATTLRPFLEYPNIGMERHLALALIKYWGFRVGGRRVSFSIFDIALFTDLSTIRSIVELDGASTNVGEMVRGHMAEWEREEMAETVWRVVIETIEDTQKKLCAGPLTEMHLNGLCLLI
ncbi:LOW QUALITY PROTEIN: hypothetical protein Cgig2_006471 [Carnegiea gigantea]|uniref:Uncharacterized protein n=1 Tax=Carnegiea gigantea TaxID=171969 RepID=A0A9Q1Q644_9CARY|nr:LOW QUALITY PROTEIN: hypothetical protein Cgig2_006471 [Carnegiea gigantea]